MFIVTAVDNTQMPERPQIYEAPASPAWIANHTAPTWRLRICVCLPDWRDALEDITAHRMMKSRQLLGCVSVIKVCRSVVTDISAKMCRPQRAVKWSRYCTDVQILKKFICFVFIQIRAAFGIFQRKDDSRYTKIKAKPP